MNAASILASVTMNSGRVQCQESEEECSYCHRSLCELCPICSEKELDDEPVCETLYGNCGHHYHLHCLYACNSKCVVCNNEWKMKGME